MKLQSWDQIQSSIYVQISKSLARHWNKIDPQSPGPVTVYCLQVVLEHRVALRLKGMEHGKGRVGQIVKFFYILKSELVWSYSITFVQLSYVFISVFLKKMFPLAAPQKHLNKGKLVHKRSTKSSQDAILLMCAYRTLHRKLVEGSGYRICS